MMEIREETAAKQKFHDKMDAAIDDMVTQVKANHGWENDDEFMEIFDAVISDDSEVPIQVGREACRRLDKPYPFG